MHTITFVVTHPHIKQRSCISDHPRAPQNRAMDWFPPSALAYGHYNVLHSMFTFE